jgi:hypothetical protein
VDTENKSDTSEPSGWRLWWLIVLVVLFPIPFTPWWIGIIFAAIFCLLVGLLIPKRK